VFLDFCFSFVFVTKASANRLGVTEMEKIVRRCSGKQHLLSKKNAKSRERLSLHAMVYHLTIGLEQSKISTEFNGVHVLVLDILAFFFC
jgi:ribosomal protein L35